MSDSVVDKYSWGSKSPMSVDDWLKKYKPSMVDQSSTPWIFIRTREYVARGNSDKAHGEGARVMNNLTKRIQAIEKDDSIPVRGKKGVKSKKVVRDEEYATAAEELKKIALENEFTCGKWIMFPSTETVDKVWGLIARSIAYGPLHDAGITTAKVSPSNGEPRHLICIYMDNCFDLDTVKQVLTILLKEHGVEPSSVKPDLYTGIDLDSNHPSKMRSSIFRPAEVIPNFKALKDEYDEEKEAARNKAVEASAGAGKTVGGDGGGGESPQKAFPGGSQSLGGGSPKKSDELWDKLGAGRTLGGGGGQPKSVSFGETTSSGGGGVMLGDKRSADEVTVVKEKTTPTPKRPKTAAQRFKEDDMFAGSDSDSD